MLFDKIIWNSVSPVRKDSTYICLEYVVNDLGVFCKGEVRTNDVGYAASRIGAPLGLTPVDNAGYAAKSLGRVAILWNKITDLKDDVANGTIVVFGNAHDKIVMKHDTTDKGSLLSRIDSMRRFCASSPITDEDAAAWKAWAADTSIANPFAPLDELIEAERAGIEQRAFTDSQLSSVVLPAEEPAPVIEPVFADEFDIPSEPQADAPIIIEHPAAVCPNCGAEPKEGAKFCNMCGTKL